MCIRWIKNRISTEHTAYRWNMIQLLYSTGLFLLAVATALYAMYLTIVSGSVTVFLSATISFVIVIILGSLGILSCLCAFALAMYWINKGSTDPISKTVQDIKKNTEDIKKILEGTFKKIGGGIQDNHTNAPRNKP